MSFVASTATEGVNVTRLHLQHSMNARVDSIYHTCLLLNEFKQFVFKKPSSSSIITEFTKNYQERAHGSVPEYSQEYLQGYSIDDEQFLIKKIAVCSKLRYRKVVLEDNWWRTDNGPLLGFYQGQTCALLPLSNGGYKIVFADLTPSIIVSKSHPQKLATIAIYFYPHLSNTALNVFAVFKVASNVLKREFKLLLLIFTLIAVLTLAFPIAIGLLLQQAVVYYDITMFWQLTLTLFVIFIVIGLLNILQTLLLLRIRFKTHLLTQPALWDRLLRLPVNFFKQYSTGDLIMRIFVVSALQEQFTQTTIINFLNGLFSLASIIILLYYSRILTIIIIIGAILIACCNFLIMQKIVKYKRKIVAYQGQLYNFVIQIITGLEKLRSAHAEHAVFNIWSTLFSAKLQAEANELHMILYSKVLLKVIEIVSILLLFLLINIFAKNINLVDFVVFNAAFIYFLYGILNIFNALGEFFAALPLLERVMPILITATEDAQPKILPGVLRGNISVENLSFSYNCDQKPILKNINLHIHAGQRVALVGGSGSGKSTLLRVLLGFEKPDAGKVCYDGIDLAHLDLEEIRKQIGCVIQGSQLIPGRVLDNITACQEHISRNQAIKIATELGFEQMIRALPMGLDTPITEGLTTFSGGEVQLIKLAGALVTQPNILLLDEATSALDNQAQERVQQYLSLLHNTQIIVAHRLSTIKNSDYIYVFYKGEIVEHGNFPQLLEKGVYFKQLIESIK